MKRKVNAAANIEQNNSTVCAYGLPHNVICIKQLLSEQEQVDLVHLSHDLYPSNLLEISPFPQHTPWIYYNWPSKFMEKDDAETAIENDQEKEKRMGLLLTLGGIIGKMIISIAKAANQQQHQPAVQQQQHHVIIEEEEEKNGNDHHIENVHVHPQGMDPIHGQNVVIKGKEKGNWKGKGNGKNGHLNEGEYAPKAIYGILYPAKGFLEAHTDAHQGWVVSISVGSDCDFWYQNGGNDERKHRVNIESGDVMVFPGYRLMHGVDAVGETVPRFWKSLQAKRVVPVQFSRYCLQFRHPM